MKAIYYESYGPPEVLHTREVPEPQAAPDELLIRVHAVEVTKADCELRSLRFPVMWFAPFLRLALGWKAPRRKIPGMYFAGTVEATGVKVTKFQPGQLFLVQRSCDRAPAPNTSASPNVLLWRPFQRMSAWKRPPWSRWED